MLRKTSEMKTARAQLAKQQQERQNEARSAPKLEDFVKNRDWSGAIGLLNFQKAQAMHDPNSSASEIAKLRAWIVYCSFHGGEYNKALDTLDEQQRESMNPDPTLELSRACCQYYSGRYADARDTAMAAPDCGLKNRLLFHVSHKLNNEETLIRHHKMLRDVPEDHLSLAAIHFLRNHFQESTDIYKKLLLDNRDHLALNVYVAMCYYKLDYYDVALEILDVYLKSYPDSTVAINLKACCHFKLYNGAAAESEVKVLANQEGVSLNQLDNELLQHNLVAFRGGENAMKVLVPLLDLIPEARLNLIIYYMRNDEYDEAYKLVEGMDANTPEEYILKGVVLAAVGQQQNNRDMLVMAQKNFQLVGSSASHCDTIPGRQCMAMCFFLMENFDDVLIYLKSIKAYVANDDDFNFDFGICKGVLGSFRDSEDYLLKVQNPSIVKLFSYIGWLSRAYIHNGKPRLAWEMYLRTESTAESFTLLQLIANDCYKMGHFFYSLKAFDVLERLDPNPDYYEGKRGAAIGTFQAVMAGKEEPDVMKEASAVSEGA